MKNTLILLLALALAGCGGSANTGSNGTGSVPPFTDPMVASGPVDSLGPLGVAGTRLNDTGTQVLLNADAARPATDLRLGMFADADGLIAPSVATGVATTTVAQSLVLGPVTSVEPGQQRLHVLALPVAVDQNTLLDGIERLDQLAIGDRVEVHGLRMPLGQGTLATRLIVHRGSTDRSVEVLGRVSEVGTSSITTLGLRVELGAAQVGLASPSGVSLAPPGPGALSTGALVRVRGTYDAATNTVVAEQVTTGFAPNLPDGKLVYVEGFVLEQGSPFQVRVGDIVVNMLESGIGLSIGSRVRLRGRMRGGVLVLEQKTEIAPGQQIEYRVEGAISHFASIADFTVRGERIDASQAAISGGSVASVAQGRRVRVAGVAGPGKLRATELSILE